MLGRPCVRSLREVPLNSASKGFVGFRLGLGLRGFGGLGFREGEGLGVQGFRI